MREDWKYGGNTENTLMTVSAISSVNEVPIEDLAYNGYLSDTVYRALVNKIDENPIYITSVLIENSPLPTETFDDVQDADISSIYKTILAYYQSGENARIADERSIGNISQEISLLENLLYQKAMNDSISSADYNIIVDYFNSKTDLDNKIKACNMLISLGNYDAARQIVSDINLRGTTEASNLAEVIDMYISTMDTSMSKNMLRQRCNRIESFIDDNNPTYSGLAKTLYEYAFDTILPKYTPLFEEEMSSKFVNNENETGTTPFIVYPNPTDNCINISFDKEKYTEDIIAFLKRYNMRFVENCEKLTVNIYNIESKLIDTYYFKYNDNINIDIRNYIPGAYILEIEGCYGSVYKTKIIKM